VLASTAMADGELRKVDGIAQKLTQRYGWIEILDRPGMTMAFRVAVLTLLVGLKAGHKVRFSAARIDGALFVTAVIPAK
jgi:Cu(I)/Ag(I) efflux system protein CusF